MFGLILLEMAEIISVEVGSKVVSKVISKVLCEDNSSANCDQVKLISDLPGRVRLRIPGVKNSQNTADKIENILKAQPWVEDAKANPITGTLLVTYNKKSVSPKIIEQVAQLALTGGLYEAPRTARVANEGRLAEDYYSDSELLEPIPAG